MIRASQSALHNRLFRRYLRWYLPRCFHTVHVTGAPGAFQDDGSTPLIVALNHTSWWDVLLPVAVEERLFGWETYGVMDERQLRRYAFFAQLGMIGVDRTSIRGAREFLDYSKDLLNGQHRSLWLTPQGAMLSNHSRPVRFQPGLSHLASRLDRFHFATIVLHYEFWDERLPEAFVSVSNIETFTRVPSEDRKAWQISIERRMEVQLDDLLDLAGRRDATLFRPLIRGSAGVNRLYDTWRYIRARFRGEQFRAAHGDVSTPPLKSPPTFKPPASPPCV